MKKHKKLNIFLMILLSIIFAVPIFVYGGGYSLLVMENYDSKRLNTLDLYFSYPEPLKINCSNYKAINESFSYEDNNGFCSFYLNTIKYKKTLKKHVDAKAIIYTYLYSYSTSGDGEFKFELYFYENDFAKLIRVGGSYLDKYHCSTIYKLSTGEVNKIYNYLLQIYSTNYSKLS